MNAVEASPVTTGPPPVLPPVVVRPVAAGFEPRQAGPWGSWATVGFTAVILVGFVLVEAVPFVVLGSGQ